jgi:hypothetical protein
MAQELPIPAAFDSEQELIEFLARAKKKAATKFRLTNQGSLQNAAALAWWLHVYGKDAEAVEVCRFLGQYQFAGNFNLWTWVEQALTLQARIARSAGQPDEAAACLARVSAAGYSANRLRGGLLDGAKGYRDLVRQAVASKDRTSERDWRHLALIELCFMIELGGSEQYPAQELEKELQENLTALRTLLKIPGGPVS